MRKLDLHLSVLKELDSLPSKQYRQVVSAILDLLINPSPHYSKQLSGSSYWRLAVGEYRVIYMADAAVVKVAAVQKRNDDEIYKMLERMM